MWEFADSIPGSTTVTPSPMGISRAPRRTGGRSDPPDAECRPEPGSLGRELEVRRVNAGRLEDGLVGVGCSHAPTFARGSESSTRTSETWVHETPPRGG